MIGTRLCGVFRFSFQGPTRAGCVSACRVAGRVAAPYSEGLENVGCSASRVKRFFLAVAVLGERPGGQHHARRPEPLSLPIGSSLVGGGSLGGRTLAELRSSSRTFFVFVAVLPPRGARDRTTRNARAFPWASRACSLRRPDSVSSLPWVWTEVLVELPEELPVEAGDH